MYVETAITELDRFIQNLKSCGISRESRRARNRTETVRRPLSFSCFSSVMRKLTAVFHPALVVTIIHASNASTRTRSMDFLPGFITARSCRLTAPTHPPCQAARPGSKRFSCARRLAALTRKPNFRRVSFFQVVSASINNSEYFLNKLIFSCSFCWSQTFVFI